MNTKHYIHGSTIEGFPPEGYRYFMAFNLNIKQLQIIKKYILLAK